MNWFARLFPKWHVTEDNLAREFEKALSQRTPMSYVEAQGAIIDVANAFGIVDGAIYITWFAIPRTRERNKEREAGIVNLKIRIVTFRHRIKKKDAVFTFTVECNWYAPITKPLQLASRLHFDTGCEPLIEARWIMEPIAETGDENFYTTVEDLK